MNIILNIIFFYSFVARLSHWLSIFQQKEYRFDRLRVFLQSDQGHVELKNIVILPTKVKDFKRPKPTYKAVLIFLTALLLALSTPISTILDLAILYVLSPAYLIIAALPFWLVSILVTHFYTNKAKSVFRRARPTIIGITGSYGKTTTKILLATLISSQKKVWQVPKSFNTSFSIPKAIVDGYNNQPIAIIEFAAYKRGEIKRLAKHFPPKMAIYTGLGNQHLALFGSTANLHSAKKELSDSLTSGSKVFINNSDKTLAKFAKSFTNKNVIKPVGSVIKKSSLNRAGFLTVWLDSNTKISTKLLGKHYLPNLELAIAVAKHLKISKENISVSLKNFTPTQEFTSSTTTHSGALIISDTRTANFEGFKAAIALASNFSQPNKILVTSGIVDLGVQQQTTHLSLAKTAKKTFQTLVHTSTVGESQFRQVFGKNYINYKYQNKLPHAITSIDHNTLVLVEGKINPSTYHQILKI